MPSKLKKILIIEDEKPMARALELKLTHEGFEVQCAFNGETALEIFEKEKIDLIISDLVMPKMDGFRVLEEMKARSVTTPIIVLSNLSQEEDRKKALSLGAKDFFIKSNTPIADIVDHVKKILS